MDAQRFGRALGLGTREMAKALVKAADAATTKNPRPYVAPVAPPTAAAVPSAKTPEVIRPVASPQSLPGSNRDTVHETVRQMQQGKARLIEQGRRAGKTALAPVTNALGVLWLEITGVFFGIFALAMGTEAWRRRADLLLPGPARSHAWFVLGIAAVFLYFAVSSFLKARRRSR